MIIQVTGRLMMNDTRNRMDIEWDDENDIIGAFEIGDTDVILTLMDLIENGKVVRLHCIGSETAAIDVTGAITVYTSQVYRPDTVILEDELKIGGADMISALNAFDGDYVTLTVGVDEAFTAPTAPLDTTFDEQQPDAQPEEV